MKAINVKIGSVYAVKVSGKLSPVLLVNENSNGGWDGKNQQTDRSVRIKSARKLRYEVKQCPGDRCNGRWIPVMAATCSDCQFTLALR